MSGKNANKRNQRHVYKKNGNNGICLNMIVKNEADNIIRCIKSVRHLLDACVICDNGSTDNTIQLIEQYCTEEKLRYLIVNTVWVDHYGWSRTEALYHAEDFILKIDGKLALNWYIMFMDADDYALGNDQETEGDFRLDKGILSKDVYNVIKLRSGYRYPFPGFIRIYPDPSITKLVAKMSLEWYLRKFKPTQHEKDQKGEKDQKDQNNDHAKPVIKRWWWNLPRHEVPASYKWDSIPGGELTCGYIFSGHSGCRSKTPNTFIGDLTCFLRELQRDPDDSRSLFYCAQSAKDARLFEISHAYYKKVLKLNEGYNDEKYISCLQIARRYMQAKAHDLNKIQVYLWKAIEWIPRRYEAPYLMIMLLNQQKHYRLAWNLAERTLQNEAPIDSFLAEMDIIEWRLYDVASIAAYQNGRKDMFSVLLKKALKSKNIPEDDRRRIVDDLKKWG